jgi:hypothetical protein
MADIHKVFLSFHHNPIDEAYRREFEQLFSGQRQIFINKSIHDGDIDSNLTDEGIARKIRTDYLSDSTVTIVLVGADTWSRKHVDWEIYSSIRETNISSRSGLLGILLPSYKYVEKNKYNPKTIPKRLYENVKSGYADIHSYTKNASAISEWIEEAFQRKNGNNFDLSSPRMKQNLEGDHW